MIHNLAPLQDTSQSKSRIRSSLAKCTNELYKLGLAECTHESLRLSLAECTHELYKLGLAECTHEITISSLAECISMCFQALYPLVSVGYLWKTYAGLTIAWKPLREGTAVL
jgi:hypothetical protein